MGVVEISNEDHPWRKQQVPGDERSKPKPKYERHPKEHYQHPIHPNSLENLKKGRGLPQENDNSLGNLLRGEVPTARLRKAFERSGMSKCQLARRLGWMKIVPNIYRLDLCLGYRGNQKTVRYETAVQLCEAMNADPYDIGV